MYRSRHVFAFVIAVVGTVSLVPAIVLLNQELGIIRVSHGVFDLRVNKVGLSNAAAVTISCSIGVTLLVCAVLLLRSPYVGGPIRIRWNVLKVGLLIALLAIPLALDWGRGGPQADHAFWIIMEYFIEIALWMLIEIVRQAVWSSKGEA